jgi:hypothetical protein
VIRAQAFLASRPFADLAREHGVYASLSADGRKASLTYDQIEARESDALACECRGVVIARTDGAPMALDAAAGDTRVVARPFDRFFNNGQNGADASAMLGRPGTRVYEKLDGTLCIVYFDALQGRWHVATRSVPEADKSIGGFAGATDRPMTFRDLFDRALRDLGASWGGAFGASLYPARTYLFELTTPFNQVVVRHESCGLWLLGSRDTATGAEFYPTAEHGIPAAPSHPCESMGDLVTLTTSRPPTESEGVVVVDAGFRRVKVKSPAYVALHGLKDSCASSPRRLLELILLGREDDAFPLLPAPIREHGEMMRERYAAAIHRLDAAFHRLAPEAVGNNPRKAFALAVQRERLPMAPMMARFAGQCDGLRGWVDQRKSADGSWSDSFLDSLAAMSEAS